ncbi:MAG: D-aminoacyl-tRNA deacylase [Promethearchaeota archaeon]
MTKFLIITSTEDRASMNIRDNILNDTFLKFKEIDSKWHNNLLFKLEFVVTKKDWISFFEKNQILIGLTESSLIHLNDLKLKESGIDPDLLIFASRHRSETARPAFLTHTTGNWGPKAEFGGNPYQLSKTSAILQKAAYLSLQEQKDIKKKTEYSLDIEVTHHGPTTLEKPLIFIELGSSEAEWEIKEAGLVLAHALLGTCEKYVEFQNDKNLKICIGFGGPHYAPNFKKLINYKDIAISFICPKYFIQYLNKEIINKMIENNLEKVDYFIIDWKGTSAQDKKHLIPILEEFDLPIRKTKEF